MATARFMLMFLIAFSRLYWPVKAQEGALNRRPRPSLKRDTEQFLLRSLNRNQIFKTKFRIFQDFLSKPHLTDVRHGVA